MLIFYSSTNNIIHSIARHKYDEAIDRETVWVAKMNTLLNVNNDERSKPISIDARVTQTGNIVDYILQNCRGFNELCSRRQLILKWVPSQSESP